MPIAQQSPFGLFAIDQLLSEEERAIRDTVREFVADQVLDGIDAWFEEGVFPREIVKGLADLGLFGMHLEGYGCAGTTATMYGVACRELEAVDGGVRSLVSVQGSLANTSSPAAETWPLCRASIQ